MHYSLYRYNGYPTPGKTTFILRWGPGRISRYIFLVIWIYINMKNKIIKQRNFERGTFLFCSQHSVWPWPANVKSLQWRHNGHNGISNHQPHDYFTQPFIQHSSKKTSKLRVTGLCAGNSPVSGEFPAQRANNAEHVSIWWRHHVLPHLQTHWWPSSYIVNMCILSWDKCCSNIQIWWWYGIFQLQACFCVTCTVKNTRKTYV